MRDHAPDRPAGILGDDWTRREIARAEAQDAAAMERRPIPFVCAECGADMVMVVTQRRHDGAIEGVTECPRCADSQKQAAP